MTAPIRSPFDWQTGEPSIFRPLQTAANLRTSASELVEQRRAAGDPALPSSYSPAPARRSRKTASTFPTVETAQGIKLGRQPKLYTTPGLVKATSASLPVIGAEQGRHDAHRRDALKRGGI